MRDAIERHRRGFDQGAATYLHEHQGEFERAVAEATARHLQVMTSELAFTDSTTMGLGLVYRGLIEPGDEVLTTTHDHYATYESLRLAGARVKRVTLYDDPAKATADEMLSRLEQAITPKTKVVALTWVHSSTGVRIPIEQLDVAADARRRRRPRPGRDRRPARSVTSSSPARTSGSADRAAPA